MMSDENPFAKYAQQEANPFAKYAAQPDAASPAQLSRMDKFARGLRDPIDGGAQLLTNMLPRGLLGAFQAPSAGNYGPLNFTELNPFAANGL